MATVPYPVLLSASVARRVQEVLQLLPDGANINEKCGPGGYTPLHMAVFRGQAKVVQNLLGRGADVSAKTSSGVSALHLACSGARKTGRGAIIRSLLQKGADVHAKDKYGRTPLHSAIAYGSIQSLKLLLTRGADISIKDGEGYNALHWAAHRRGIEKQVKVIQILLAHGTDVSAKIADLSATTDGGKTPEQLAFTKEIKGLTRSVLLRHKETRRAMLEAFTMGQHAKLGANSRVLALSPDVVQMIMDRV
jgi:hypothetical protein